MDMGKYGFNYVIDIRGTAYGKITIGLVSFETSRYNALIQEFNQLFLEFRRTRNKGCTLKQSQLKNIIGFLDKRKVHMVVLQFGGEDWRYYKEKYGEKGFFKEKIIACLYFLVLKKLTRINHKCCVIVDNDSWMKVIKATSMCKKLAKANKYDFDFSIGYATQDDRIRIVDFVATSFDKLDRKYLNTLKYYKIMNSEIPGEYLKKLFS